MWFRTFFQAQPSLRTDGRNCQGILALLFAKNWTVTSSTFINDQLFGCLVLITGLAVGTSDLTVDLVQRNQREPEPNMATATAKSFAVANVVASFIVMRPILLLTALSALEQVKQEALKRCDKARVRVLSTQDLLPSHFVGCLLPASNRLDDNKEEQELAETEDVGAHT